MTLPPVAKAHPELNIVEMVFQMDLPAGQMDPAEFEACIVALYYRSSTSYRIR
jgi:hypothetical protein